MRAMRLPIVAMDVVEQGWKRRKAAMVKLRDEGETDTEIARRFGISKARVGQILGPRKARERNSSISRAPA